MKYLETYSIDPCYNLAFEEYVLKHCCDDDYLLLWQNEKSVIIGQNQNMAEEVNLSYAIEHGIKVVRRSTGGGAVFHDLGNLNYSFITGCDRDHTLEEQFVLPIVNALQKLGLDAHATGRNDILVGEKKISGTAQKIYKDRILHHGTLLFDADLSVMSEVLRVDAKKYESKGIKSVKSRVGNMNEFLKDDMSLDAFWTYLRKELCQNVSEPDSLFSGTIDEIKKIQQEKYDSADWNNGRNPRCNIRNKKRYAGGSIEVRMQVQQGKIEEIVFYGDFLSNHPLEELTMQLQQCEYHPEVVRKILEQVNVSLYFGTITLEEILEVIF